MNSRKIKNIIFPIEFDHFTGGMIHSVMSLASSLTQHYNVYILAHKNAEVLKFNNNCKHLILQDPWSISFKTPLKSYKTYKQVKKLLQDFDLNETIVFTNNVGSELIFSGFGLFPIKATRIFVSRGGDYLGKTGVAIKQGFKSVKHFIATSQRQVDVLIQSGVVENKIELIHNGVYIRGCEDFNYHFKKSGRVIISVIGYLMPEKNQELIIRAMKNLTRKYPELKLFIFGTDATNGVYKHFLKSLVESLDLKNYVVFAGFEPDKVKIYSMTDILVSTSLSEGFGRTVVEAMSFGIPCIALEESGGVLDILTDGIDGILIQNNIAQLESAISCLVTNSEVRSKISEKSKMTYKMKFTEKTMTEKYLQFLHNYE